MNLKDVMKKHEVQEKAVRLARQGAELAQSDETRKAVKSLGRAGAQNFDKLYLAGTKRLRWLRRIWRIVSLLVAGTIIAVAGAIAQFTNTGAGIVLMGAVAAIVIYFVLQRLPKIAFFFISKTPMGVSLNSALGIATTLRTGASLPVIQQGLHKPLDTAAAYDELPFFYKLLSMVSVIFWMILLVGGYLFSLLAGFGLWGQIQSNSPWIIYGSAALIFLAISGGAVWAYRIIYPLIYRHPLLLAIVGGVPTVGGFLMFSDVLIPLITNVVGFIATVTTFIIVAWLWNAVFGSAEEQRSRQRNDSFGSDAQKTAYEAGH